MAAMQEYLNPSAMFKRALEASRLLRVCFFATILIAVNLLVLISMKRLHPGVAGILALFHGGVWYFALSVMTALREHLVVSDIRPENSRVFRTAEVVCRGTIVLVQMLMLAIQMLIWQKP